MSHMLSTHKCHHVFVPIFTKRNFSLLSPSSSFLSLRGVQPSKNGDELIVLAGDTCIGVNNMTRTACTMCIRTTRRHHMHSWCTEYIQCVYNMHTALLCVSACNAHVPPVLTMHTFMHTHTFTIHITRLTARFWCAWRGVVLWCTHGRYMSIRVHIRDGTRHDIAHNTICIVYSVYTTCTQHYACVRISIKRTRHVHVPPVLTMHTVIIHITRLMARYWYAWRGVVLCTQGWYMNMRVRVHMTYMT